MTFVNSIHFILALLGLLTGFLMFWSLPSPLSKKKTETPLPFISIIVPARNEAARIQPLLRSLKQQYFQSFELVVVDDESTDATAQIAKKYGARVLQSRPDQAGAGKSMACWRGAKEAQGEWLLFLDADTSFADENGLETLLRFYANEGASGILSLQPFHTVFDLYENLSAIFNIIVVVGMNVFTILGKNLSPAGSFGPSILCKKDEYFAIGGHKKIRDAVMDDIALGKAFMAQDLPVRCLGGKDVLSFRMYPEGFNSLIEGWCKSFALGSASTHPLIMGMVIVWISGSFISLGSLIGSLISGNLPFIFLSILTYIMYAGQTALFARRTGDFNPLFFLFYPVFFLFFAGLFLYSLFRVHILRSVTWRGRDIDV